MYFPLMDLHPAQLEREYNEVVGTVCVCVSADGVCVICVAIHTYMHMCWLCVFVRVPTGNTYSASLLVGPGTWS